MPRRRRTAQPDSPKPKRRPAQPDSRKPKPVDAATPQWVWWTLGGLSIVAVAGVVWLATKKKKGPLQPQTPAPRQQPSAQRQQPPTQPPEQVSKPSREIILFSDAGRMPGIDTDQDFKMSGFQGGVDNTLQKKLHSGGGFHHYTRVKEGGGTLKGASSPWLYVGYDKPARPHAQRHHMGSVHNLLWTNLRQLLTHSDVVNLAKKLQVVGTMPGDISFPNADLANQDLETLQEMHRKAEAKRIALEQQFAQIQRPSRVQRDNMQGAINEVNIIQNAIDLKWLRQQIKLNKLSIALGVIWLNQFGVNNYQGPYPADITIPLVATVPAGENAVENAVLDLVWKQAFG